VEPDTPAAPWGCHPRFHVSILDPRLFSLFAAEHVRSTVTRVCAFGAQKSTNKVHSMSGSGLVQVTECC